MSVTTLYAGSSSTLTSSNKLPSPTDLETTLEQIWSENTGRAQSGANQAKMVGDSITGKHTYAIKWGVLTNDELTTITNLLTRGFFYFGLGTPTAPPDSPSKYYRSEIHWKYMQVGTTRYYKDVSVSVIEQ